MVTVNWQSSIKAQQVVRRQEVACRPKLASRKVICRERKSDWLMRIQEMERTQVNCYFSVKVSRSSERMETTMLPRMDIFSRMGRPAIRMVAQTLRSRVLRQKQMELSEMDLRLLPRLRLEALPEAPDEHDEHEETTERQDFEVFVELQVLLIRVLEAVEAQPSHDDCLTEQAEQDLPALTQPRCHLQLVHLVVLEDIIGSNESPLHPMKKQQQHKLSIVVQNAKLLYDLDEQKGRGKQDPYVVLQLAAQKVHTKPAINQGRNPSWNQKFDFLLDENNPTLKVTVMDSDTGKKKGDELIGEGLLNILQTLNSNSWEVAVPLYKSNEDQGTVTLDFDFPGKQRPKPQDPTPSQPKSQLKLDKDPISYHSIDYESQLQELDAEIAAINQQTYQSTSEYLKRSNLLDTIQEGLAQLAQQDPPDQVQFMIDFLLKKC